MWRLERSVRGAQVNKGERAAPRCHGDGGAERAASDGRLDASAAPGVLARGHAVRRDMAATHRLLWLLSLSFLHSGSWALQTENQLRMNHINMTQDEGHSKGRHHESTSKPDWLIQQLKGLRTSSKEERQSDGVSPDVPTSADDVVQSSIRATGQGEHQSGDISSNKQAGEDLMRLLETIAEKPARWRMLYRTLQKLERDLQVSRDVIEQLQDIEEAVDGIDDGGNWDFKNREHRKHRHGELRKKKTRHKQNLEMKFEDHLRTEQLDRTGLLPPGEENTSNAELPAQEPLHSLSPSAEKISDGVEEKTSTSLNMVLLPQRSAKYHEDTMHGETDSTINKTSSKKLEGISELVSRKELTAHSLRHKQQIKNGFDGNITMSPVLNEGNQSKSKVMFMENTQPSQSASKNHFGCDVNLRHHGKLAIKSNLTHSTHRSREIANNTRDQNTMQIWADVSNCTSKYLGLENSSLAISLGAVDHEASHIKNTTSSQHALKDDTDKWPVFPSEAAERDNSLWPLQQERWSKPSSLEAALGKQKALATNEWSARSAQKPARHFTYHRVTSSPQVQRPRQRSAFVAVSVAVVPGGRRSGSTTPPPSVPLPDKMDQLLQERRDPLERQLTDLPAHESVPWSHARHLNNIQEKLKTLSAMEQKLQYRWLEKQRLHQMLRDGGKERAIFLGSSEDDGVRNVNVTP